MGFSMANWAIVVGMSMLAYAMAEAIQYRDMLKMTQQEFTGLPFEQLVLLAVGTLISFWGGLRTAGKLKPIHVANKYRTVESTEFRANFMSFNHRGKLLPVKLPALSTSSAPPS